MEKIVEMSELDKNGTREKQILAEYSQPPEGINLKRIRQFARENGFPNTSIFWVPKDKAHEIIKEIGGKTADINMDKLAGGFHQKINCVLMFYSDKDDLFDLEKTAIHELAHANLGYVNYENGLVVESGLSGRFQGDSTFSTIVIEEAYAEYFAGKYAGENIADRNLDNYPSSNPNATLNATSKQGKVAVIKNKYLTTGVDGNPSISESAIPANALENIFEKYPILIKYFNLIRQFPSLKKNLATNFNQLFPKSLNAFEIISIISMKDNGYEFYEAVQKILKENE